jgi:hypothetical protein
MPLFLEGVPRELQLLQVQLTAKVTPCLIAT